MQIMGWTVDQMIAKLEYGQVQSKVQELQFLEKGKKCHNIPLKMKHCGATELSPAHKSCSSEEHVCFVQTPAKITTSSFFYFFKNYHSH